MSYRTGNSEALYRLCGWLVGHRWMQIKPGVKRCSFCRAEERQYRWEQ